MSFPPSSVDALFAKLSAFVILAALPVVTAKDSSWTPKPSPPNYGTTEALGDLHRINPGDGKNPALDRLLVWSLYHSFGGAKEAVAWLEHPRARQALWLALATHAILQDQADASECSAALAHLRHQKALDTETVRFFQLLWSEQERAKSTAAASAYLRAWLARFALPQKSAAEIASLRAAVERGFTALRFTLNDNAP